MIATNVDALTVNPDGIILGDARARKLSLTLGENVTVTAPTGEVHTFKILGLFHTGRADYDNTQTFADLKRVQALLRRLNRANTIIMKLDDPRQAHALADGIERRFGVAGSQRRSDEHADDAQHHHVYGGQRRADRRCVRHLQRHLDGRAGEAARYCDPQSMGFRARDIQHISLIQGVLLGFAGSVLGLPFGAGLMLGLMQIRLRFPGSSDPVPLPIDWNWPQFAIAAAFAMGAASAPVCCRPARRRLSSRLTFRAAREAVIEAEGLARRLAGEVTVTLVEGATLAIHGGRVCRDYRRVGLRQILASLPSGSPRPADERPDLVARG
jgi:lipoprotein-releasing system permease protein